MSRPLPPSISSPVIVWCVVGLLVTACSGLWAPSPSALHTAQVTIRSTGAMPSDQTIPDPAEVVFYVVDDSRHEIHSGPHPEHTGCPALNIGAIGPNADRKTGTIRTGTCQFHDELNLGDPRFQGTIRVQ
jgi:hypothetical protein